jgi:threonine/homoserine/homoserine lactone efflux protein
VTGILNPKVALFFLAFLPQFVCPARGSVLLQFVALGSALGILDVCYESALVLLASGASSRLAAPRLTTWRSRFTGGVLLGLGLKLAFVERR